MRRRFVGRLIAATAVAVFIAIGLTTWLSAAVSSSYDLRRADNQASVDDRIRSAVTAWAAERTDWNGASAFLIELEKRYQRRIALLNEDGTALADPAPDVPLGRGRTTVIDLLDAGGGSHAGHIQPTAAGALRLDAADQARLWTTAERVARCAHRAVAEIELWPTGRPVLPVKTPAACGAARLNRPLASEQTVLTTLKTLTERCLSRARAPQITAVALDLSEPARGMALRTTGATSISTTPCLQAAWQTVSRPVTPAAATLYTGDGVPPSVFDLSPGSMARILLVAATLVLLVIGVAFFVGGPAMRRIRSVSDAAQRLAHDGAAPRLDERGGDEIAALSTSFNEMADELSRVQEQRRQMIADTAHELRTPLTNIRGWLEADLDGIAPSSGDLTTVLAAEARQLARIVDDLQTLALADAGELRIEAQAVDLGAVAAASVEGHRARAEQARTSLIAEVEPGLMVTGDAARLRQVIDNLVGNALRHDPAGAVRVRAFQHAGEVTVRVEDAGSGIESVEVGRVFDRFWRGDRSRTRGTGGSGLGLAIAQQLVQAHRGSIEAENVEDGGAAFTVRVPSTTAAGVREPVPPIGRGAAARRRAAPSEP